LLSVSSDCDCFSLNYNTYVRFDPELLAAIVKPLSPSQRNAIYNDPYCGPHLR
jgi:hypothetical protein